MNINAIINKILCDIKNLSTQVEKKIKIFFNGSLRTDDVSSINFTGNVQVTSDSLGNTEVNIPNQSGGGGETDCEECLEFDGDRPITRNVLGLLGQNLGTQGVIDTLEELLYPYLAPSITLAVTQSVIEKSSGTVGVLAQVTTTKGSLDITDVFIQRSGNTVYTETSVNPNGQSINFNENVLATDNTPTTPYLLPYRAFVDDGQSTQQSPIRNVVFVYPFYNGVGAAGANEATIKSTMGKQVIGEGNKIRTYTANNQKLYFIYPAAYGFLSSITDGALNLTPAFTTRTEDFTMLDGQTVSYRIYESINLVTVTNYVVFFNF